MKQRSSKLKFIVWGCEVIFSCFILFTLFVIQILLLNVFYRLYKTNTLENVSDKIKENTSMNINELEKLAYENGICIMSYNNNEYNIISEKYNIGCSISDKTIINTYLDKFIISNKEENNIIIRNNKLNNNILIKLIKTSDNSYIFLSTSIEALDSSIMLLKSQYKLIILIILILSIVVGYFISYIITKPIIKINESAKRLGKGDFSVSFNNDSNIYEIKELSNTLEGARSELSKTDELRRDLMANVSHDLKTPLTMIKAYAEMTKDFDNQSKEDKNKNMDIIVEEVDRLTILVNDILDLSKLQSGTIKTNIEDINVDEIIKNIIKRYDILVRNEGYNFIYEGIDKLIIKSDSKRLEQVIYNLINNAINYTGDDKKVIIKVSDNKSSYLFEIIDTGHGIKKSDINNVWNKYYHSDKMHKRNMYGTGLGLSIVKEIMEELGYKYGVKSSNKGTTFYFEIKK